MATGFLDLRTVMADLIDAADVDDRWRRMTGHLAVLGMDQINYGILDTAAANRIDAPVRFLSTMNAGWIDYYVDRGFGADDPHVTLVRQKNIIPYRWTESLLPSYDKTNERLVLELAVEAGLRAQLQVTLTALDGTLIPVAGMAMGSSLGEDMFRAINGREADLITIAHLFHQRSIGELRRRHHGAKPLTLRERDCLTWLANGSRIDRIAEKLGVARVTIEMHLRNARRKLGAATIPEAVAKALWFQEIRLG